MDAEVPAKYADRIVVDEETGCWLWQGHITEKGYGRAPKVKGVRRGKAHRFMWRLLIGPVPTGCVLHHTCHVHHCVNPSHMQLLSSQDHSILHYRERFCPPVCDSRL